MFSHNFKNDLEVILDKIYNKENFAFNRFADGEFALIHNEKIVGIDGWEITDQDIGFGKSIIHSLDYTENTYYKGISCRCCDLPKHEYFKSRLSSLDKVTFSNLFVNGNWDMFLTKFPKVLGDREVVLVSKERGSYPFNLFEWIKAPSNVVKSCRHLDDEWRQVIKKLWALLVEKENTVFLFCAGPASKFFIHWCYTTNKNNVYLDIGSALDPFHFGRVTRDYQNLGSEFNTRKCVF